MRGESNLRLEDPLVGSKLRQLKRKLQGQIPALKMYHTAVARLREEAATYARAIGTAEMLIREVVLNAKTDQSYLSFVHNLKKEIIYIKHTLNLLGRFVLVETVSRSIRKRFIFSKLILQVKSKLEQSIETRLTALNQWNGDVFFKQFALQQSKILLGYNSLLSGPVIIADEKAYRKLCSEIQQRLCAIGAIQHRVSSINQIKGKKKISKTKNQEDKVTMVLEPPRTLDLYELHHREDEFEDSDTSEYVSSDDTDSEFGKYLVSWLPPKR